MVSNNTVLIVIIVASLIGASNVGAWQHIGEQISLWEPNEGIQLLSLIIFPIACAIGLGYYIWECNKRLRSK